MTTKTGSTLSRLVAEATPVKGTDEWNEAVDRLFRYLNARAPLYAALEEAARECSDGFLDRYTIPPKAAAERLASILKDLAALDAVEDSER